MTLIELLVVMAIVAVLAGLVLVVVQRSREMSRRAQCQNHLHQLVAAQQHFVDVKKRNPLPPVPDVASGWSIELLPFLEAEITRDHILASPELTLDMRSPQLAVRPTILSCPSAYEGDSTIEGIPAAHYAMLVRDDKRQLVWFGDVPIDFRLPWASGPEPFADDPREHPYRRDSKFRGPHGGGFYASGGSRHNVWFIPGN